MIDRNYHTHTTYGDGDNTAREMVEAAIQRGMKALGFSEHSSISFDEEYYMRLEKVRAYRREVKELAKEYAERLDILCGLEYDIATDGIENPRAEAARFDYLIGSAHYIPIDERKTASAGARAKEILASSGCRKGCGYAPVDVSRAVTEAIIDTYFDGDAYAYCETYFATVAEVCEKTGCHIIGHFDLITKFNEDDILWKESHPRYVAAYRKALDALLPYGVPFEINTGAMGRGRRTVPYPSRTILEEIYRRGGKIALSSDAHEAEAVKAYLDEAATLAREIGFSSYVAMSKAGPEEIPL